jgi:hypothetical protein
VKVVVELSDLTRQTFDELRMDEPEMHLSRVNQWFAELKTSSPQVTIELSTRQPPVVEGLRAVT